ncbi:DinB superfamily protein [Paenibacillus sp. UNCCL117]|uniref:DinB family protein n=1 Tax=unclassified Paenibacillus TaxID=185978 RepID=UPI00088CF3D9|nr:MULTISPECIES: DinB family protein [unclassified Paenibacillus]SDD78411.1 DinB superfamily protein [Paenibacillus sp. cl123]SFW52970.1 DinB superfamily protein [Paenibacillus sp. UNCCL117]
MPTTMDTLQRLEETTKYYIQRLETFSMEQLLCKPDEEEWSIGQMYMHLIGASRHMHIRNIELCLDPEGSPLTGEGEKSEAGQAVFQQGSFPPIRIRVPASPAYTPAQPERKEQLAQGLEQVLERMRELQPLVGPSAARYTVDHPRFGGLNAGEWFRLVEMHYRHHLLQLDRLTANMAAAQG